MARKSRKHLLNQQQDNMKLVPPAPTFIAGIYARVSSRDKPGNSIENQVNIAETFIEEQLDDIKLHKVYTDHGISSFAHIRPGFLEILQDAENQVINCIIVKDISRFTREYLEAGDLLQKKFPVWKVRFISVNDGFDSLYSDITSLGNVLQTLIAYMYSRDLSTKITSIIHMQQEMGIYTPPRLSYGYKKEKTSAGIEWQPDEATAGIVKEIFNMASDGYSVYAIIRSLTAKSIPAPKGELWSASSISRMLRDESYIGTFVTGKTRTRIMDDYRSIPVEPGQWIRHRRHHVPIVDEAIFEEIQERFRRTPLPEKSARLHDDFFMGKLYCGVCGRKMKRKKAVNGAIYYVCPRRDELNACSNKSRNAEKLKAEVYGCVVKKIAEAQAYRAKMMVFEKTPYYRHQEKTSRQRIDALKEELNHQHAIFRHEYEKAIEDHRDRIRDTQEYFRYLVSVRKSIQDEIIEIEAGIQNYQNNESSEALWLQPYFEFENENDLTRDMLYKLVRRIVVNGDDVEVKFM